MMCGWIYWIKQFLNISKHRLLKDWLGQIVTETITNEILIRVLGISSSHLQKCEILFFCQNKGLDHGFEVFFVFLRENFPWGGKYLGVIFLLEILHGGISYTKSFFCLTFSLATRLYMRKFSGGFVQGYFSGCNCLGNFFSRGRISVGEISPWGTFWGRNSPRENLTWEKLSIEALGGENFQERFSTEGRFPARFEKQLEIKEKKVLFQTKAGLKIIFKAELSTRTFFGGDFQQGWNCLGIGYITRKELSDEEFPWGISHGAKRRIFWHYF